MSEENDLLDESDGIKNLRKLHDDDAKRIKDLEEKLGVYAKAERDVQVREFLKAKGVSEDAATLYQGDDISEGAVGKWVDAHAAIFHPAAATQQDDPNAAAAARVNAASTGNSEAIGRDELGRVIGDPAELMQLIKTQPYEELVRLKLMPANDPFKRPRV